MMICPKCSCENDPENLECIFCGVIFAKTRKPEDSSDRQKIDEEPAEDSIRSLLLTLPGNNGWPATLGRMVILGGLVLLSLQLAFSSIASNASGQSWLHLVNLPFHEAGHIIFRPLGSFIASLGGTLGQLLVPLVCLVAILIKGRDPFGASVCLWWFGENLLDIAPYINDARAGQLPLVGGNFGHSSPYGFHDWEYLLTESGLLHFDQSLARLSHLCGSLVMVLSIGWGGYVLLKSLNLGGNSSR